MKLILLSVCTSFLLWCCRNEAPKTTIPQERKNSAEQPVPFFDGVRAFEYLTAQTDFGPRNPGSPGHRNCLNYLQSEMQKYADAVDVQAYTETGYGGEVLKLSNIISSFNMQ